MKREMEIQKIIKKQELDLLFQQLKELELKESWKRLIK